MLFRGKKLCLLTAVLCMGAVLSGGCTGKPEEGPDTEEIPVVETEEIRGEEIPAEETTAEEIPVTKEPAVEAVQEPPAASVEIDRTKYALPPEQEAAVYTGYRVDYNKQMQMGEEYSRWYVMELPQITGEDQWNREIADRYFQRYGSVIAQLEQEASDIYKFFAVSYEVILWEDTCTIAIRHHGGYNGSGAVGMDYDIHHYNWKTGEFLTTDEFLELYTGGQWDMQKCIDLANGYGFSRDETGEIWEIPEENFQGVIPSSAGNGLFDLCFQGVSYEGAFASRVMVMDYVPYVTKAYEWMDLGGGTHTTEGGQEYHWLLTNVDAGYRLSVYYPLVPPTEYASRRLLMLDITLAPDSSAPQITFSEETGNVFLHLTGKTTDGPVQDKVFLCRQAESAADWFMAYCRGWITEETLFQDPYGWVKNNIMDSVNALLEVYASGGDVDSVIAAQEVPEEAVYPAIPVRTAVEWDELYDTILPARKKINDYTWMFPIDLGSGYTMEVYWCVGGMGDGYNAVIGSVRMTTGENPITAWRPQEGDALLFAEAFGDTGKWLLSYTSHDGQPVLYSAYLTESGKAVHEKQVLGRTGSENSNAIWAEYTPEGNMLVLLETETGEPSEVSYRTFVFGSAETAFTPSEPEQLLDWWMEGAPVRFPNVNMPYSGDTPEELTAIPETVGQNGLHLSPVPTEFIAALLRQDADTIAELSGTEAAMYENLQLFPERYVVWMEEQGTDAVHFLFLPEERSLMEGLQEGWNHYLAETGYYAIGFYPQDRPVETYTGAAEEVRRLLDNSLLHEIPESNDMESITREYLTDYILLSLHTGGRYGVPAEEIAAYAEKHFGITGFVPAEKYALSCWAPDLCKEGDPELYAVPGRGGWGNCFRITGTSENRDGSVDVKVQFYADYNCLVRSHRYRYTLREIEGEWVFESCRMDWKSSWDIRKITV